MQDPPRDGDGRPAGFEVITEEQEDVARVRASGELDLATAPALCARVTEAIRHPANRIILDLTQLDFCDSQGLRAIVGLAREARAHAIPLVITVPDGGQLARLIELTGTAEFLPITHSSAPPQT